MLQGGLAVVAISSQSMTVRRVGAALGAVVDGVDLRALTEQDHEAIRAALDEHQVLIFRGQGDISVELQIELASIFGVPGGLEPFRTFGEQGVGYDVVESNTSSREVRGHGLAILQERNAALPPQTDRWHTDMAFAPNPPVIGTLYPVVTPEIGGDTAWVSLYGIYDALSQPLQELCEHLQSENTWAPMRATFIESRGPEFVAKVEAAFPPQRHPLVQVHRRTGRKLVFFGARTTWMNRIVGLKEEEADLLLEHLRRQLDHIEFQFRWHWSPGEFGIWDQQSTNHQGLGDHYPYDPNRIVRSVWAYPTPAGEAG